MAFQFESPYSKQIEERMKNVFDSLSEKDRRRYAAIETEKLGYGGQRYISELFGCSEHAIRHGLDEIESLPEDPLGDRQRAEGGGRKQKIDEEPEIEDQLFEIVDIHIAGSPDEPDIIWTHQSPQAIAATLTHDGTPISAPTVADWLEGQDIRRRKIEKSIAGGQSPDRDTQFQEIDRFRSLFREAGDPVFSIDTKAKELLGTMYRDGRAYLSSPMRAFDHDYPSWSDGVLIPHGIYDPVRNHGHLNLGLSHDTSEFACDSFWWFWRRVGRFHYAGAKKILWLCDAGGSNNARYWIFKEDLSRLATRIGLPIQVAHYPPYCSKYNPIERRFFSQVGRTCSGLMMRSAEFAAELMRQTSTATGLSTTAHIIKRAYELKRKATEEFMTRMPITFSNLLPRLNYTANPS
ncbi:Rhodopirellula transposase [Rubripirellula lacrimiformis]|uniref:Rhodopirellula transposase n=1 Tax=Rubripirellula lacrimiformis TaxID=1930273 RepID=A0A517NIH0_9BACT|nr:ISAzo13 family transposase [Rubripirellula lacrimiformis]QDT04146.1 Rhodopirellula transposase [Rubripirellula lacrimiformis]QDT06935.1 Rhodopirellula transposase [Rubripirellula lacrimiformis]